MRTRSLRSSLYGLGIIFLLIIYYAILTHFAIQINLSWVSYTLGLINVAEVHSASIQDREVALDLFIQARKKTPTLQKFFADQGYTGELQNRCFLKTGCLLTIAKKASDSVGFQVIPKRWIVERTFAWLSNFRRISKDYEHSPETSKTNIFFNMTTVMLRKLAHP